MMAKWSAERFISSWHRNGIGNSGESATRNLVIRHLSLSYSGSCANAEGACQRKLFIEHIPSTLQRFYNVRVIVLGFVRSLK